MKYWVIFLILLLLGTNGFWLLSVVDNVATCMYTKANVDSTKKMYRQSIILSNLDLKGKTADEAISIIVDDVYGLKPFEKGGCVYAGQHTVGVKVFYYAVSNELRNSMEPAFDLDGEQGL